MHIYAICNQKGGVGKTTTAAALLEGLKLAGYKTLAIELDPQQSLAQVLKAQPRKDLAPILAGTAKASPAIVSTNAGDIIPATANISTIELNTNALKPIIKEVGAKYDYIIIDTPPTQGKATLAALTVANSVIIPSYADTMNLTAVQRILSTIKAVKDKVNPGLKVEGVLITRYDNRSIINKSSLELITNEAIKAGTKVFNTKIREGVKVREAQAMQQGIFEYSPKEKPMLDYEEFIKEVLNNA